MTYSSHNLFICKCVLRSLLTTSIKFHLRSLTLHFNMSGTSSVGNSGVYEAGDQRNYKDSEINNAERFKEGKANSHQANDSSKQHFDRNIHMSWLTFVQRMSVPLPTSLLAKRRYYGPALIMA